MSDSMAIDNTTTCTPITKKRSSSSLESGGVSPPRPTHFRKITQQGTRWEVSEEAQEKINALIPLVENFDWSKETRGREKPLHAKKRCYEEMVRTHADVDSEHPWLRCNEKKYKGYRYPSAKSVIEQSFWWEDPKYLACLNKRHRPDFFRPLSENCKERRKHHSKTRCRRCCKHERDGNMLTISCKPM